MRAKKRAQDAVFPESVVYDFDKSFGTSVLAESYQLMTDIVEIKAKNQTLARRLLFGNQTFGENEEVAIDLIRQPLDEGKDGLMAKNVQ